MAERILMDVGFGVFLAVIFLVGYLMAGAVADTFAMPVRDALMFAWVSGFMIGILVGVLSARKENDRG